MESEPTLLEWKHLYDISVAFRDLAPWKWLDSDALFAVQNPETGEMGYCSVMGSFGQFYALGVYLGTEGWASFSRLKDGDIPADDPEAFVRQKALMVSFEGSTHIDKRDKTVMNSLNLHYRGKYAWPLLRSYEPGYAPWYLTGAEARFLTKAIEQAVIVAKRAKTDETMLIPHQEGIAFARIPVGEGQSRDWIDKWIPLPDIHQADDEVLLAPQIDEIRLQRLWHRAKCAGLWEVDFTFAPFSVQEGIRPMFPRFLVCVDHDSGLILKMHLSSEEDFASEFVDKLIATMENVQIFPKQLFTMRTHVAQLFQPLAQMLNIEMSVMPELQVLKEARDELLKSLK